MNGLSPNYCWFFGRSAYQIDDGDEGRRTIGAPGMQHTREPLLSTHRTLRKEKYSGRARGKSRGKEAERKTRSTALKIFI